MRTGAVFMKPSIVSDIQSVQSIKAIPSLLRAVVEITGMRFACVARVTPDSWTTCAVEDRLGFGLKPGDGLEVTTTLCNEVRQVNAPIVIGHVSQDATYCQHPTPKMYGFESYISLPLYRVNGEYFGTLCALDPLPAAVSDPKVQAAMRAFCELISVQLEAEQRYDESQAALADVQNTAELREQFIAVLGHDMRTPLGAVITGTDLLLRFDLEPRARIVVESIRRSGQRMARLVDDVLDFARGRLGGGIALEMIETDSLHDSLHQVIAELQRVHPHRLIYCTIEEVGKIRCSPDRICQLLSNVLTNALHYGDRNRPIRVDAYCRNNVFTLSVTNHGTPIPADMVAHLFQPYRRGSTKMPHAGLGLGLYIASEIARSHLGTLNVVSTDEATTFTFLMPLQ